jgi:hypothetical protein
MSTKEWSMNKCLDNFMREFPSKKKVNPIGSSVQNNKGQEKE